MQIGELVTNIRMIRLTLMSRTCPLFKLPANLLQVQVHDIFPEVYRVVAAIPSGSCHVIDMAVNQEYTFVRPCVKGEVVKLWYNKINKGK